MHMCSLAKPKLPQSRPCAAHAHRPHPPPRRPHSEAQPISHTHGSGTGKPSAMLNCSTPQEGQGGARLAFRMKTAHSTPLACHRVPAQAMFAPMPRGALAHAQPRAPQTGNWCTHAFTAQTAAADAHSESLKRRPWAPRSTGLLPSTTLPISPGGPGQVADTPARVRCQCHAPVLRNADASACPARVAAQG